MKYPFKYMGVLALAGIIISCNNSKEQKTAHNKNELEKAKWLLGEWANHSPGGIATEKWVVKNDSAYAGTSSFVIGKDTVSSESISLEQHGNSLYYVPTVKEQNNGKPVRFTLTSSTAKELVFENPAHDFPQKISYSRITNDSILAEISGTMEGKHNSQEFPMVRVK